MGQLKSTLISFGAVVLLFVIAFTAINSKHFKSGDGRDVSGSYGSLGDFEYGVPQGHTYSEKEELWHLSEGADFLPLRWFINIKSVHTGNSLVEAGTYLYEDLQDKYGVSETSNIDQKVYGNSGGWNSPMKWLGLTLAWSEPLDHIPSGGYKAVKDLSAPSKPDSDDEAHTVLSNIDATGFKTLSNSRFGGEFEIPMVGTNCTLCHSNIITFNTSGGKKDAFVEGAPAMLNVRNFFRDMGGGAFFTMLTPEALKEYILRLARDKKIVKIEDMEASVGIKYEAPKGYEARTPSTLEERAEKVALTFNEKLMRKLEGVPDWTIRNEKGELDWREVDGLWATIKGLAVNLGNKGKAKKWVMKRALGFPENKPVLEEFFGRFLALSYGVDYQKVLDTPSLKARMRWLSILLTPNPKLASTPEGYGRTDAFGRISNAVARGKHELPLIAPVSFPPMWGMQFSNLFHFNGNTNSVIMRNIGQSFGLGALVFGERDGLPADAKGRPLVSSNIYNLNRIEKHLYNIKYPEWNALVPDELKIDTNNREHFEQVQLGCEVYANKCMGCHDSGQRVGPKNTLVKHFVHKLQKVRTDPNHNQIQPTPILTHGKPVPFRQGLFQLTKAVKNRYIEDMGLTDRDMADWENREHRGQEHFRDTWLGENFRCFEDEQRLGRQANKCWLQTVFNIDTPNNYRSDYELKYMALVDQESGEPLDHKYGYIAKSLAGIWATPPFLHNGSVPNLDLLLKPTERRPDKFYTGCRVYDPEGMGFIYTKRDYAANGCTLTDEDNLFDVNIEISQRVFVNNTEGRIRPYNGKFDENGRYTGGDSSESSRAGIFTNGNYNGGHDLNQAELATLDKYPGSTISQVVEDDNERKALITFLKVLRPTKEYAWSSEVPYSMKRNKDETWSCTAKAVSLPSSF